MIPSISRIGAPVRGLAASPEEALPAALEQALSSGSPDTVRRYLESQGAQASPQALGAALDLALRHNDVVLGDLILQKSTVPPWEQFRDASDEMRSLHTYARRKHILYPAGINRDRGYTELDQALWKHDRRQAERILQSKRPEPDLRAVWANAIKEQQLDVLRALILLRHVERYRGFRLFENPDAGLKEKIRDEALRRVLKEVPHYSPRRRPENLNSTEVACRHLVQHWMAGRDAGLKFNYEHFRSKRAIHHHVHVSERDIDNMKKLASEAYLVNNRKLGAFIAKQFGAMVGARHARRKLLVASTEHEMSLELMIKTKDEHTAYVLRFFDPNLTTTHARSACESPQYFDTLDIRSLVATPALLQTYFPEDKGQSMMFVRPPEDVLQNTARRSATLAPGRRLAFPLNESEIDATTIWHLLAEGFDGSLRDLEKIMQSIPDNQRSALLSAKHNSSSGLFMALQNGHAHVIEAFGVLLKQVQDKRQRVELLAASGRDNTPGLFMALQFGHGPAIAAFGKLLDQVPDDSQRAALAAAVALDGTPGLHAACMNGHDGAVQAFGELLTHIQDKKRRAGLLAAKRTNKTPGLYIALVKGHAGVIRAYGTLLDAVLEPDRISLLEARDASNIPGVYWALREGQVDAVEAFVRLVQKALSTEQGNALLIRLYGRNAAALLTNALKTNKANIIRAFGKLLPHLPADHLARLLADTDIGDAMNTAMQAGPTPALIAYAEFGISMALQYGHVATAEAFAELLDRMPDAEQRRRLLAPIHDDSATALFGNALQNGETDIIRTFGKLTPHLAVERQAALLTDAASRALRPAIQAGHVQAIMAFAQTSNWLVPELSPVQRKVLLNAYRSSHTERVLGIQGARRNDRHYEALKAAHPEFYARFKNMKDAMK